ncbi:MAG: hypothetical protein QM731_24995 [Chitinophagaceae bacterium]
MKVYLGVLIVFLLSCENSSESKITSPVIEQPTIVTESSDAVENSIKPPALKSFVDSIAAKYDLSVSQVHQYLGVDSVYYTGYHANAVFTGDSVWDIHNGFKGVVVDYDDRANCLCKFLFVLDSTGQRSISYLQVMSSCDRDFSSDYYTTEFSLLNKSRFGIKEFHYKKEDGEDGKPEISESFYSITNGGKIVQDTRP